MMKRYRRTEPNNELLEKISYSNITQLKFIIKHILMMNETKLEGDSFEVCLIADVKTAMGLYPDKKDEKVLSKRQRTVIMRHLVNDEPQKNLAKDLDITQQGVSIILNSALTRIKNYLVTGSLKRIPWSQEERDYLLENYNKIPISEISEHLDRPSSKVISMYYYLKNLKNKGDLTC